MKRIESVSNDRGRRLFRQTSSPKGAVKMNAALIHPLFHPIGAKAGAPDMPVAIQQKNRPVLHAVFPHLPNLSCEPLLYGIWRERSANQRGDIGIAP